MSCEFLLTATIEGISKFLDEEKADYLDNESDSSRRTLQNFKIGVSPIGEIAVFAKSTWLLICGSKWDSSVTDGAKIKYSPKWHGHINCKPGEEITCVFCLPFFSQGQSNLGSADWTCIILGFSSGCIRFYTEEMQELACSILHEEKVTDIKCFSTTPHVQPGKHQKPDSSEIYVLYKTVICILNKSQLIQTLQNKRNELAKGLQIKQNETENYLAVDFKKYSFVGQEEVNDACYLGQTLVSTFNTFDHLVTASLFGGFNSNFRASPPQTSLIVSSGRRPFVGFHYTLEGSNSPMLTDVALAVASKIKNSVTATLPDWFSFGSKKSTHSDKPKEVSQEYAERLSCRFGLCDVWRQGISVIVSPNGTFSAVTDSLGRVTLIDNTSGIAHQLWKGYRDAQCGFIQVQEDVRKLRKSKTSVSQPQPRQALFIVIYAPKKGLLEIFTTQHGRRVTTFKVPKSGRLIYNPAAQPLLNISAGGFNLRQSQVIFITEEGFKEFSIPFHCALAEDNSKISRDLHVLKKIKMLLKMESNSKNSKFVEEIEKYARDLKTDEIRLQAIESMITYRNITLEAFKVVLKVFLEPLQNEARSEAAARKIVAFAEVTFNLLLFYEFVLSLNSSARNSEKDVQTNKEPDCLIDELRLPHSELDIILKLIQQILEIEKVKHRATRVVFDDKKSTKLVQYLSCFDFESFLSTFDKNDKQEGKKESLPCRLNFRSNGKENSVCYLGDVFYKDIFNNFSSLDQWKKHLEKCCLNPQDVALSLLSFWCGKNIEEDKFPEVLFFVDVLKWICSLNEPETVAAEYNTESPWWKQLRNFIAGNPNTIQSLYAALCCRSVTIFVEQERELSLKRIYEKNHPTKANESSSGDGSYNDWETISKDSCQWDILIVQLQDVALLNAILNFTVELQPSFSTVPFDFERQCLTSIQLNGTGRVSELVAKWLAQFGLEPRILIDTNDVEFQGAGNEKGGSELSFVVDKVSEIKNCKDSLDTLLEYLALLKSRFPYSLTCSSLLANLCWEYLAYWFKNISCLRYLEEAIQYMNFIPANPIKYGVSYLTWNTYLLQKLEILAKMVNRIGKVPNEKFCIQEIGFGNVSDFLLHVIDILRIMVHVDFDEKPDFGSSSETIWQSSSTPVTSSLVSIALSQPLINSDLVLYHLQLCLCLYLMSSLKIKHHKLFSSLFDNVEVSNFTQMQLNNHHHNSKFKDSRTEFLKKCLSAAVQTITVLEAMTCATNVPPFTELQVKDYKKYVQMCVELAEMWAVPLDGIRKHQVFELYSNGFDRLAEEVIPSVNGNPVFASQLLVIGGKRLKYLIHDSENLHKKLTGLSANLSKWLDTLDVENFRYDGNIDDIEVLMCYTAQWLLEGSANEKCALAIIESLAFLKVFGEVKIFSDFFFKMDPLYLALSYYRRKKYDKCIEKCTEILGENAYDQAAWLLKMKAFTEKVYIDDLENEEDSIADEFLDDNVVAEVVRAGTSLRNVKTEHTSRPRTEVGHLVSGVVRTNLLSARTGTMEQTLRSARRMKSARPVTSQSGRYIRLGTASMLSENGGSFIEVSRLNLAKYATEITGKHLFEYLFYQENDIQHALELSSEATRGECNDWWWTVQQGKCFFYLNLLRESEQNLRNALKQHVNVDIFLRLIRIYKKMDQPLSALDVCDRALEIFPYEISLIVESARLHEALGNISLSVGCYRNVVLKDASNIEAIACIGLHYFYSDQPEIALRFYKRLLQMGLLNVEVLNNIGLCCFYSQNYDLALSCFKRALTLADSETVASVWYNLSHVAIGSGDLNLARFCLRLCLSTDGNHASALNNLGVLEARRNKLSHAKSFFMAAVSKAPLLFEPHFNLARLTAQCGDLHSSYRSVQKALEISGSHTHAIQLHDKLRRHFIQIQ